MRYKGQVGFCLVVDRLCDQAPVVFGPKRENVFVSDGHPNTGKEAQWMQSTRHKPASENRSSLELIVAFAICPLDRHAKKGLGVGYLPTNALGW